MNLAHIQGGRWFLQWGMPGQGRALGRVEIVPGLVGQPNPGKMRVTQGAVIPQGAIVEVVHEPEP